MPTVLAHQGSLGEIVMGPGTPYQIDTWAYLDVPSLRTDDFVVPGQDGVQMAPADTYNGRDIAVRIIILGAANETAARNVNTLRTNLNALMGAIAQWGALPIYQTLRLSALGDAFVSRWVGRVRGTSVDDSTFQHGYVTLSLRFESIRSWRERDDATTFTLDKTEDDDAVNAGTIPVFPTFTITAVGGSLVDPQVEDTTHSLALIFDGLTLLTGEVLVLDVKEATAIAEDVSVYSLLDQDDWFMIPPGTTNIEFNAASGNGTCLVSWRDGYL